MEKFLSRANIDHISFRLVRELFLFFSIRIERATEGGLSISPKGMGVYSLLLDLPRGTITMYIVHFGTN